MRPRRVFVPERGDLVKMSFDPQSGHEQAGWRPTLVISPALYNRASRLALVCPATSRVRGYPFEVALPQGLDVGGVFLPISSARSTGEPGGRASPDVHRRPSCARSSPASSHS